MSHTEIDYQAINAFAKYYHRLFCDYKSPEYEVYLAIKHGFVGKCLNFGFELDLPEYLQHFSSTDSLYRQSVITRIFAQLSNVNVIGGILLTRFRQIMHTTDDFTAVDRRKWFQIALERLLELTGSTIGKCPVCKTTCCDELVCPECGFDDINRSFVNVDEAQRWQAETVLPYRKKYWATLTDFDIKDTVLVKYRGASEQVRVPFGISTIFECAFMKSRKLRHIYLPSSVCSVQDKAFEDCINLQDMYFPAKTIDIGNCFSCCKSISRVILPFGVDWINLHLFGGCKNLTEVVFPAVIGHWGPKHGPFWFSSNNNISAYLYEDCQKYIVRNGFLVDVDQEEIVAFLNRKELCAVVPDGISRLRWFTFERCRYLQEVVISDGVIEIERFAFSRCFNLSKLTIPHTTVSIVHSAFHSCHKLTHLDIDANNPIYKMDSTFLIDTRDKRLIYCTDQSSYVVVPKGIKIIGEEAFVNKFDLQKVVISEGVEEIKRYAFQGCSSLKSISLPKTLIEIGDNAFSEDDALCSIVIPAAVKNIGDEIFSWSETNKRVFCEVESKPEGWSDSWGNCDSGKIEVYWRDDWHYEPVPNCMS